VARDLTMERGPLMVAVSIRAIGNAVPDIPLLLPLLEDTPFAGAAELNDVPVCCCARTPERSSIWRRCRLGAEVSIRFRSTDEFTTLAAPPLVINSAGEEVLARSPAECACFPIDLCSND
jgi:hypothetical protein